MRVVRRQTEECPTCQGTGRIDLVEMMQKMLDRPGKTGSSHPSTSRVAGTTPRKGAGRHLVMRLLSMNGPSTARELSDSLDFSPNQTATRVGELHDDLFVEYVLDADGELLERTTTPGNTGFVHQLTPLGKRILQVLES